MLINNPNNNVLNWIIFKKYIFFKEICTSLCNLLFQIEIISNNIDKGFFFKLG